MKYLLVFLSFIIFQSFINPSGDTINKKEIASLHKKNAIIYTCARSCHDCYFNLIQSLIKSKNKYNIYIVLNSGENSFDRKFKISQFQKQFDVDENLNLNYLFIDENDSLDNNNPICPYLEILNNKKSIYYNYHKLFNDKGLVKINL